MPISHSIHKHRGSQTLRCLVWGLSVLSVIALVVTVAWFAYMLNRFAFDKEYFDQLLDLQQAAPAIGSAPHLPTVDNSAAGQFWGAFLGGIIAGSLTLLAALIALGGVLIQMRRESNKEFLKWVVDFNYTFHADGDYSEVRHSMAEGREFFFQWIILELKETATALGSEVPSECINLITPQIDKKLLLPKHSGTSAYSLPLVANSCGISVNWSFVRKITDYFRFYEMVLIVTQRLPSFENQRGTFLSSFAWQIGCILSSWGGDDVITQTERRISVIYYLACNNFENLCANAVYLLLESKEHAREQIRRKDKKLKPATRRQLEKSERLINAHLKPIYLAYRDHNNLELPPEDQLVKYWKNVLGKH